MSVSNSYRTPQEWLSLIGKRLRDKRLRMNMKQSELASRAGVSVGVVNRLEHGDGITLEAFIGIISTLRETNWLEQLAQMPTIDPKAVFNQTPVRKRAR
jgi:transcriptional regulator with XRE-family HTH domain